jgi:hypothetical protein
MQISRRGGPTRCKSRPPSHATMRQTRAMASWAPRDQRVGRLAASHHLSQPITPSLLRWPAVRPRNVSWFPRSRKCQSSPRGGQISETLETAISHHFSAPGGRRSRIRSAQCFVSRCTVAGAGRVDCPCWRASGSLGRRAGIGQALSRITLDDMVHLAPQWQRNG